MDLLVLDSGAPGGVRLLSLFGDAGVENSFKVSGLVALPTSEF